MTKHDGGPFHPSTYPLDPGCMMRDWLAAQVMVTELQKPGGAVALEVAEWAYLVADAMLYQQAQPSRFLPPTPVNLPPEAE